MVVPFIASAAWLGLGALGVLGAKEKDAKRSKANATLREQRAAAENAVNRNYIAAQNRYSRYLQRSSTIFDEIEQERWNALATINNEYLANRQNSSVLYDFTLPILKGTSLALDLFGTSIFNKRRSK